MASTSQLPEPTRVALPHLDAQVRDFGISTDCSLHLPAYDAQNLDHHPRVDDKSTVENLPVRESMGGAGDTYQQRRRSSNCDDPLVDSIHNSSSTIHRREVAGSTVRLPCPAHEHTGVVVRNPKGSYKSSDASRALDASVDPRVVLLQTPPRIPSEGLGMEYS